MLELLYQALQSPHGIEIESSDNRRLIQRLYAERRKAADPALETLTLVQAPNGFLWIIKRTGS